jgi:hypothetical protein
MDLWSINFGSWDLAADNSAIEKKKRAKYLVSDTELSKIIPKRVVKIRKVVQIKQHVRKYILAKT